MNVLLINPPYPVCESLTMPLGLLYLASRLEGDGHAVTLADLQLSRAPLRRLRRALDGRIPDVVGMTSFSINVRAAGRILKAVRDRLPRARMVWGGPHASFDDQGILAAHPWVDAVVRGEGEETLAEIVSRAGSGDGLEGVLGATWRDGDGRIVRNGPRPFREDLETLPRPAWHLLELSKYLAFGDGASLLTSRGCPHRCLFCVGRRMIGAKGRFRSPEAVVDEMAAIGRLGFRRLRVEDDLFTYERERALAICQEICRRRLRLRWRAYSRVDTVDDELLSWMRRSGCERLLFGAESGCPEILRGIRKGITPEQTRKAVEMTRRAGIDVLASFVLGLPGETPATLHQTVAFAESLGVPFSLNLLTPYVGTEVRHQANALGIQILSDRWELYGQGRAVTATAAVGPWHLSRAVGRHQRDVKTYLTRLLEGERRGHLNAKAAGELRRHRYWGFLREVIGGDLLDRFGAIPRVERGTALEVLGRALSSALRRPLGEIQGHLITLRQSGCIRIRRASADDLRWDWA